MRLFKHSKTTLIKLLRNPLFQKNQLLLLKIYF